MSVIELVWGYGEKVARRAEQIASLVDKSDAAYYECGYFLVYCTLRGWRRALGLTAEQTTSSIYSTDLGLMQALLGHRNTVPPATWNRPSFQQQ